MFQDASKQRQWIRLVRRVVPNDSGCWIWQGATTSDGYPHVSGVHLYDDYKKYPYGHRLMWAVWNDRWPDKGEVVRHTCDTSLCVNPRHLLIGSQQKNVDERGRSGRWFGAGVGKLNPEQVEWVRTCGLVQTEVARTLNISQAAVSKIRRGETYRADGLSKLTRSRQSKLSEEDVRDIRRSTISYRILAARYNVTENVIYQARVGITYKWVTPDE